MNKKLVFKIIYVLAICLVISSVALTSSAVSVYEDYYYGLFTFINNMYKTDLGVHNIMGSALNGAMDNLSEYSYFELAYNLEINSEYGIGAYFEKVRSGLKVVSVLPSSPAHEAGIKSGDIITLVDKHNTAVMGSDEFNAYMIDNRDALLEIIDVDSGYIKAVRIESESTSNREVDFVYLDNTGYIRINNFSEATADRISAVLKSMENMGNLNLILDLRNLISMNIEDACSVADLLVPGGTMARTKAGTLNASAKTVPFSVKILVNEGTAGAAEVIAGAVPSEIYGSLTAGNAVHIARYPVYTEYAYAKYAEESGFDEIGKIINYIKYRNIEVPEGYIIGYLNIVESSVYYSSGRPVSFETRIVPDVLIEDTSMGYMGYKPEGDMISVRRNYSAGNANYDIYMAKKILSALGIFDGPMNVVFGEDMTLAVNKYKSGMGYPADGILDMEIQAVLNTYSMKTAVLNDKCVLAALEGFQ